MGCRARSYQLRALLIAYGSKSSKCRHIVSSPGFSSRLPSPAFSSASRRGRLGKPSSRRGCGPSVSCPSSPPSSLRSCANLWPVAWGSTPSPSCPCQRLCSSGRGSPGRSWPSCMRAAICSRTSPSLGRNATSIPWSTARPARLTPRRCHRGDFHRRAGHR